MDFPRIDHVQFGQAGEAAYVDGTPASLATQQPDAMIDAGVVSGLTIRAASVRGAGHRYDGTPRQDDFCLAAAGPGNELLIVAVADGVSAGPQSHIAARIAVRSGVKMVAASLAEVPPGEVPWDEIIGRVAGQILLQARSEARDDSLDARGAARFMASTVAFAVVPATAGPDGRRLVTVLRIGDTSVWVLSQGRSWQAVTSIKNAGEAVASSATMALPLLPTSPVQPITVPLQAGDALFVVSDGVGDPLGDGSTDVGEGLARLWATPPNRYEFAAQVDFARRSHTDDRTAVGVWCDVEPPGDPYATSGPAKETEAGVAAGTGDAATTQPYDPAGMPVATSSVPAGSSMPPLSSLPPLDSGWQPTPWEPEPWEPPDLPGFEQR